MTLRHRFLARASLRLRLITALLAGAIMPLGFAPLGWWPLTWFSFLILMLLIDRCRDEGGRIIPRDALWIGYAYGIGQFGVGVGWVYESFTLFGAAIAPVAGLITALFVLALAWYPAFACYAGARMAVRAGRTGLLLSLAASWILFEWVRGWLFTGFPWLDIGVAQITGPLAGYLPLVGEYGTGLIMLLVLVLLVLSWTHWQALRQWRRPAIMVLSAAVIVGSGQVLNSVSWTKPVGAPVKVGIAQGNVPQMQKFNPNVLLDTLKNYLNLTEELSASHQLDLVVWPETAVPDVLDHLGWFRKILREHAEKGGYDMLVGAFAQDDEKHYYNALVGIPAKVGQYEKRHLVPFGEYMPMRKIIDLFSGLIEIPMSDLTSGAEDQPLPVIKGVPVGASICYEAAIAREIRKSLPDARVFVNASNDSWFGDSFAPYQHLQMAQVRALEFGRPMLRATNTGVSALIDAQGNLTKVLPLDKRGVLYGTLEPHVGNTPYFWVGSIPAVVFSLLLLVWVRFGRHRDDMETDGTESGQSPQKS